MEEGSWSPILREREGHLGKGRVCQGPEMGVRAASKVGLM